MFSLLIGSIRPQIVKVWVKKVSRARGLNEQLVHKANAKFFTSGSYRLGVHGPDAKIDALCIGPIHADRDDDFFGELKRMLIEMPNVMGMHSAPDAHVPVIKFKLNGASVDLLYVRLSLWVIPEMKDQILRLVPNIQAMVLNNSSWLELIEPYCFFEAYKNYMQIDIAAENDDLI